mgnify:CR=1 FL=1
MSGSWIVRRKSMKGGCFAFERNPFQCELASERQMIDHHRAARTVPSNLVVVKKMNGGYE